MAGLKNYLKQMKRMGKIQQTPETGPEGWIWGFGHNSNCCAYVWKRLEEGYSNDCPEASVNTGEALSRCGVRDLIKLVGLGMITVES